ncbi:MAG: rhomboid family intramembrane serine protease [Blastocatellia bacterium]
MSNEHSTHQAASRVCPNCGKLTPAERPDCLYCGAVSAEEVAARQEAERERHFISALFTRSHPFALIIIGINAGVFLLEWLAGGMGSLGADPEVIRAFGAKNNELIQQQHQYWRLVTSIFIHIGFLHFLLNNYALWIIGQEIELLYGSARFVALYLLTGLAGSLASYTFNPNAQSAGASGAIFGLFGVMAAFAFRYRKELPQRLARDIRRRILPVIAINLIFGFSVSIVDNAAHIGGLLAGVVLALIVPYKRPTERGTSLIWRTLQVICLAVMLISFVAAFRSYDGPKLSAQNLTKSPQRSQPSEDVVNRVNDASHALLDAVNSFMKIIARRDAGADVQPALSATERGINDLKDIPTFSKEVEQLRGQMLEVLTEQRDIVNRFAAMKQKDWPEIERQQNALVEKAQAYKLIKIERE